MNCMWVSGRFFFFFFFLVSGRFRFLGFVYGLTLGRHASCELLAFNVDHAYTPLMGSSVGLRLIQETN